MDRKSLGELELLVALSVAALGEKADAPRIRARIIAKTSRKLSRGAVYSVLERLHDKRLLDSELVPGDEARRNMPSRRYLLNGEGHTAIRRSLTNAKEVSGAYWPDFVGSPS
ncbi:MAG: helix-turn-helix transcriptional regulator [Acidobacteria bacterium]|nr:helix-turn-helix transcriptional regulator [Acidobacteriota bacterium]